MALAKDTLFEISDYNVPKIVDDADAWVHMILNLLFLENGTYSDAPELGLDLKHKTYMETEQIINFVETELNIQVALYMPGIPLSGISVVVADTPKGDNILYITISFDIKNYKVHKSAFVSLNDEIVDMVVENYSNHVYQNK